MPIPIIVWAAVAAGGGYLAWKNRKAIGKTLEAMGDALAAKANREVDELLRLSITMAEDRINAIVPKMDALYWPFFKNELAKRVAENSAAFVLLERSIAAREKNRSG